MGSNCGRLSALLRRQNFSLTQEESLKYFKQKNDLIRTLLEKDNSGFYIKKDTRGGQN